MHGQCLHRLCAEGVLSKPLLVGRRGGIASRSWEKLRKDARHYDLRPAL